MTLKLDFIPDADFKPGTADLRPLFNARNRLEFVSRMPKDVIDKLGEFERSLTGQTGKGKIKGFCIPCGKAASFRFDMQSGGRQEGKAFLPNWRERLICQNCKMSNRQRLVATLVMQHLESCSTRQDVYLMEQTTPLYKWATHKFKNHSIAGSEYLGSGYRGGEIVEPLNYQTPLRLNNLLNSARHKFSLFYSMLRMGGIRHENLAKLSFSDAGLDLIVSNDVFEHVPNPAEAFAECARVLKEGGVMFATIPFHCNSNVSIARAKIIHGHLEHVLPPSYHGNPVSTDGSLVFTDFGWDVLEDMTKAGFSHAFVEIYASAEFGHLGGGQLVFKATK